VLDDRIGALEQQVGVLRRLRDSLDRPDPATVVPGILESARHAEHD
jgi:hypothetical protein